MDRLKIFSTFLSNATANVCLGYTCAVIFSLPRNLVSHPPFHDCTLTIISSEAGIKKSDLVNDLGIVSKSGTKTFIDAVQAEVVLSMIGQPSSSTDSFKNTRSRRISTVSVEAEEIITDTEARMKEYESQLPQEE